MTNRELLNLVSTLFLAEAHYDVELLIETVVRLFTHEEDKRAVSFLVNWFYQLVVHGRVKEEDCEALAQEYHTAQEVRTMLVEALAKEKEQIRQQGIEQGIEQGQKSARIAMLLQLLQRRFETAEEDILTALSHCTLDQLQSLVNPALDAPDLDTFLGHIPKPDAVTENKFTDPDHTVEADDGSVG